MPPQGETLAIIQGAARPILSAERTALNFLAGLSRHRDRDPGYRRFDRRVSCARSLHQENDSRPARSGKICRARRRRLQSSLRSRRCPADQRQPYRRRGRSVRGHPASPPRAGHMVKIEVEVDTLAQLELALKEKIDAVLLDNMPVPMLTEAVRMVNKTSHHGSIRRDLASDSGIDCGYRRRSAFDRMDHPQRSRTRSLAGFLI